MPLLNTTVGTGAKIEPLPHGAPFLEIALAAEVPLITGNERHFPVDKRSGCTVLSPGEFIGRYCTS